MILVLFISVLFLPLVNSVYAIFLTNLGCMLFVHIFVFNFVVVWSIRHDFSMLQEKIWDYLASNFCVEIREIFLTLFFNITLKALSTHTYSTELHVI